MSCAECRETFDSGLEGKDLQIEVDTRFPNFACEEYSICSYSPGRIEAEEQIVFLAIHPIHYDDQTGVLSPTAFEQLTRNDLSVLRRHHATRREFDEVRSTLVNRGSRKVQRSVEQCCVVDVALVRAASDEVGRTLGVYDTALEELPAHASIFVRSDFFDSAERRLEARRLALSVFGPHIVPLETIIPEDVGTLAEEPTSE